MTTFTIIDAGAPAEVSASVDGERVRVATADVERALQWELKPEGFCLALFATRCRKTPIS